jgi:hypothetical protein
MIKIEIEYDNGKLKIHGNGKLSDGEIIQITPLIVKGVVEGNASQVSEAFGNKNANMYAMAGVCIDELSDFMEKLLNETNAG